jgi:hypothetical protein
VVGPRVGLSVVHDVDAEFFERRNVERIRQVLVGGDGEELELPGVDRALLGQVRVGARPSYDTYLNFTPLAFSIKAGRKWLVDPRVAPTVIWPGHVGRRALGLARAGGAGGAPVTNASSREKTAK